MKASVEWLSGSGAEFSAGAGRTGCAQLSRYTARYCEWGDGAPVVLVPGLAGGYDLLGPLARLLARRFRVISYQLRGEDDCFELRRRFGLSDLASDLAEFLDWRRLEQPALFGVSFGGIIALEFATRQPARLQALVVQGVGAGFEQGLLQQVAGMVLNRYPLPSDNPFVNQFFNLLFGKRQKPGPQFQFVTRTVWQTDQSVMAHRFRLVEQYNMEHRLERVDVPTLVISGERDLLVSPRSLAELCDGLPQCETVRFKDAGHLAAVTHAAPIAQQVCRFLQAHSLVPGALF